FSWVRFLRPDSLNGSSYLLRRPFSSLLERVLFFLLVVIGSASALRIGGVPIPRSLLPVLQGALSRRPQSSPSEVLFGAGLSQSQQGRQPATLAR
ncbi:MAG: hypothetical protein ACKVG4_16185, partial [Longimicrobiales bacterium]